MNRTAGFFLCCILSVIWGNIVFAQDYNPIPVAMPSLQFAPDARGGGMGDIGAATMPDAYSQHWNAAKYPFISTQSGVAFSYTPWLSKLVSDIHLLYASGYWKPGNDNLDAVSASLRYFSLGNIDIADMNGKFWQTVSPHEFALDLAYSRRLSETFAGAVTLRYIRADYSTGDNETTPGNAFAADLAGYNESYLYLGHTEMLLGLGFNLSNIGTKISYDGGTNSNFLPTNMRLGVSLGYPISKDHTLSFSADLNKLLVPTPQLAMEGETAEEAQQRIDDYQGVSSIEGIFKSFGDAPGGLKEELQEIMWSVGMEYTYLNQFSVRTGYYHEAEYKGNRRYFTFGAGFRMKTFQVDAAYLISTAQTNPLDQTLRLSLGFDIEGIRNLLQ
ncbi:MAG: type IX secretion system outer membrane channel protein PorV [Porphyromonadaceae bacterium]|nr:type IX secretion system outer membrane channel protein PorV [Porphyromonadaceae bacterium]